MALLVLDSALPLSSACSLHPIWPVQPENIVLTLQVKSAHVMCQYNQPIPHLAVSSSSSFPALLPAHPPLLPALLPAL